MKTIHELVEEHLAGYIARRCYANGIVVRRYQLYAFARWLAQVHAVRTPNQLQSDHLQKWLLMISTRRSSRSGLTLKASTIELFVKMVRIFCRWLGEKGFSVPRLQDAFAGMRRAQLLPRATPAHPEIRRMLNSLPAETVIQQMVRTQAEVLYSSGMRPCELLAMNMGDVDFDMGAAKVFGKGRERMVFFGKIALRHLKIYITGVRPLRLRSPEENALWLNCHGRRLTYARLRAMLEKNLPQVNGKPMTAYVFRRAYATELIRSGASPWMVKEGLGHSRLNLLSHYVQLTIMDLKKTHTRCHPRDAMDTEDTRHPTLSIRNSSMTTIRSQRRRSKLL